MREQDTEVQTRLAGAQERLQVHLESRALEDLLLAAAEGYRVPPGRGFK